MEELAVAAEVDEVQEKGDFFALEETEVLHGYIVDWHGGWVGKKSVSQRSAGPCIVCSNER